MKVERQISWWDEETLIDEINIDHIPFEELKGIVQPPLEDSPLYNRYAINQSQAESLRRWVEVTFDFKLYSYSIECWPLD